MTPQPDPGPASRSCGAVVSHDVPRIGVSRRTLRRARLLALAVVAAPGLLLGAAAPASAGEAPSNGRQAWNFHQIHLTSAVQNAGRSGSGVVVAVVDTWVQANHSELSGRVLAGADCVGHGGTCQPGPPRHDACGHGTHVAGTVAGRNWGVAPRATILPVRVLAYDAKSGECTGSTDDVAAGINWATGHGAQIINLSLAPEDAATQNNHGVVTLAVQHAVNQGVIVVFAAGNSDRPVDDNYDKRALIVAATGPTGGLASYSQRGQGVAVAAPGGDPAGNDCAADGSDCIIAAWKGGGYAALAGTSMAAPHVSGLAALLLGQHASSSANAVVSRIRGTAHPLAGAGSGRIDAAAALGVRAAPASSAPKKSTATPSRRATAASKVPPPKTSPKPVRPAPASTATPAPATGEDSRNRVVAGPAGSDDAGLPRAPVVVAAACLAAVGAGLTGAARGRLRRG